MQQTAQQLRVGGAVALGIGILNLLIFGLFALAEHNQLFILAALAPCLVSSATGIVFFWRAQQVEIGAATTKPAKPKAPADPQALRQAGNLFLSTGAAILVVFALLALATHIAAFFFAAVAPGVIFISVGLLYALTSDPGKRRY
jgi:uncharacterized iron-regulated membrane protein